ncbi:MAG: TnpV protein [Lachnospiraceae bacterium]|nr:TnpV protein [Lachnospiraceae bacterium]
MKGEKYHIYLSTKERNEIVASLINLKNKLIEQGRYTDAVDDVLFKVLKQKRIKSKLNMCKRHLAVCFLIETGGFSYFFSNKFEKNLLRGGTKCLSQFKQVKPLLSKYVRMRERYLKEHKRVLYYTLLTSGKLYERLAEIDTSACDMAEYLIKEMAINKGVTEQLKAVDMMRWIGLMNNIRSFVDEIVLNDIVYS